MILCVPPRFTLFLVLAVLAAPAQSLGEEVQSVAEGGPLDGMAFAGKLGPAGDPDLDDVLYFNNGHFWSSICTICGFAPGAYWARNVDGGISFRGDLESQDRGRFSYKGFVRDGRITVTISWRQERWYWTIDRNLSFEGRLSEASDIGMTLNAAREAAGGKALNPSDCPS